MYEFRDSEKKTHQFFIDRSFRGVEPVLDTVSPYADQARYKLAFDPADDKIVVGCYVE